MTFQLTVDLSTAGIRLKPGSAAEVLVTIRNIGQIVQHYEVLLVGMPADNLWTRDPEVTKLRPGDSGKVTVRVSLPEQAQVLGGTYVVGVLVRSPYQPTEVSRAEELAVTIESVAEVAITAYPEVVEGRSSGTFTVTLANKGNTPVSLDLTAADDQGRASFTLQLPSVYLQSGGIQPVGVSISAPGPFTGQERRSSVTVRALSAGEQRAETKVSFVQKPRVPAALLRGFGVVLAVAVVAAAIIIGGQLGRQANTVNPNTPQQPRTVASSAGASPPPAATVEADTAPLSVGVKITWTAKVASSAAKIVWALTDADKNQVGTASDTKKFRHTFTDPGDYDLAVTLTTSGGTTTTSVHFTVAPKLPDVHVSTSPIDLPATTPDTEKVSCPSGKTAISGGVVADPAQAPNNTIQSSSPGDDGAWHVDLTNSGSATPTQVTLTATCVAKSHGSVIRANEPGTGQVPADGHLTLEAGCNPGEVALGGGGGVRPVTDPGAAATLEESRPLLSPEGIGIGWRVIVTAAAGRTAEARAICAPQPNGYQVVVTNTDVDPGPQQPPPMTASCSSGQLLGGGLGIAEQPPRDPSTRSVIHIAGPVLDPAGEQLNEFTALLAVTSDVAQTAAAYAICADLT